MRTLIPSSGPFSPSLLRAVARALLLVVCAGLALPAAQPAMAADDYAVPNGHFFTQTAGGAYGYTVLDDGAARFWSEFQRLGGVDALGYPISVRFMWNGFVCQAMQRAVLQWRPESGQAVPVNVFDLMHEAGKDGWLLAERQVPLPVDPSFDGGKPWDEVVAGRLSLLDANPAIRAQYYRVVGDPIAMNGLPTSPVTDMGNNYTLRAQRTVIQQWKVDVPWAAAGQVTVGLGGSIAAEAGLLPPAALLPEQTPGSASVVGATPPQLPAMPAGGFGYGFQVDPSVDYDRALQLTNQAGFNWVKVQVRWKDLEPAPGNVQWGFFDQVVGGAQARGLRLLFSVTTAPMWARGTDANPEVNGPPASIDNYARFVGSIAARYKGRVAAYEIWNEQNLARDWGGLGRVNANGYVAMLQASYRAVKAADPNALVLTGALTPVGFTGDEATDDLAYFRQMYDAGMAGFFDAVGVHPSGFNNAPSLDPYDAAVQGRPGNFHADRSFYFRNFEAYRAIMVEHNDSSKPLWFTEFGWASGEAGDEWAYARENTPEQQAAYLVEALRMGKASGYVGAMFVWNLNFTKLDEGLRAFAVLNPDWSPRPAYQALAGMAK